MALPSSHNPVLTLLPNLLLVLAVATGIIITEPSLHNDRKLRPGNEAGADGDRSSPESYFWDDPFRNIVFAGDEKSPNAAKQLGRELGVLLAEKGTVKTIFVGLEGSANPADVERRIRTRLAVTHALCARAGMIRCAKQGLAQAHLSFPRKKGEGEESFGVAVECFYGFGGENDNIAVSVIYVNESRLELTPAAIGRAMTSIIRNWPDDTRKPTFDYIGLCRSDQLVAFLNAAREDLPPQGKAWDNPAVRIYSPHATVDDVILNGGWGENRRNPAHASFLGPDYRFRLPPGGYGVLHRVGAHDGELVSALVAELENRGLRRAMFTEASVNKRRDATLLLADMDRYHSRMLVKTFGVRWGASSGALRVIHYPEALDALGVPQSAGASAQAGGGSGSGKTQENATTGFVARGNPGGSHAAEGFIQFDSLARLPARIRELEKEDNVRYRAIGLFGSDVHDKLQILRALKPQFPQALFFTNDLDARLWQGENRSDSINLVVAGAFGLSMNGEIQGSVAPFRSSYQTATYLACLHAIGYSPDGLKTNWLETGLSPPPREQGKVDRSAKQDSAGQSLGVGREVEIHEVGRTGDQLLAFHPADTGRQTGMSKIAHGRPASVISPLPFERIAKRYFRLVVFIIWLVLAWYLFAPILRDAEEMSNGSKSDRKTKITAIVSFVAVTCLCALAAGWPFSLEGSGAHGEGGGIFAGVSAKPVLAANYLIIAIGIGMVNVLIQRNRIAYPYPFRLPPSEVKKRQKNHREIEFPGDASTDSSSKEQRPSAAPRRPSILNLCGIIETFYLYIRRKNLSRLLKRPIRFFRRMPDVMARIEAKQCISLETWIKSDAPEIVRKFARERLVNRNRNMICRVLLYLLLGLFLYYLIHQRDVSGIAAPTSIRGEEFRRIFEISDVSVKAILAVLAAIALDRQVTLITGLEKLRRFLEMRTLREAAEDDLKPPYEWHHRPEVVDTARGEAEARFGVGEGPGLSGHEGFWEMPLLRTAAERFREVAPCMVLPYMLAFLILVTRHPVFEKISSPTSELVLFGFILLGPLAAGMLVQNSMASVFAITQKRIRGAQRFVVSKSQEQRNAFLSGELKNAEDLQARTKYGFFNNPIVEAILLPLGGYGVLQFSTLFSTLLK
jgi:hypothetical protein